MRAISILGLALSAAAAFAQSPSFDAASIKLAPPPTGGMLRVGISGGPGTKDPGLFRCDNCTISMLVTQAYDIKNYQLSGPAALDGERFNITARVPEGASKEQFRLMLQNLLADRFKLAIHRDKKEMAMYQLVVAKGGSKLKESVPAPAADGPPSAAYGSAGKMEMGKDGFPVMAKGIGPSSIMMNGRARTQASDQTMQQLAALLANQVGKPVTDATGLKGKYDFTLTYAPDTSHMGLGPPPMSPDGGVPAPAANDADPLPNIFLAVQEQLGLRLEAKKGLVDTIVVDHVEKTATDN
ncbi:MAG: TIGR03435 family protein [Acidobacteriota bacterium]|nr:TIGR03435 family protein [Acidobacteriota bacterium]